jgi:putative transposase
MQAMSKRAQKYRFYPTDEQAILLAQTFGCARVVYNNILRWRTDAFYKDKQKISYAAVSSKLTALKKKPEFDWLNKVSSVPLQQTIRNQQAAFSNFFAGRAKYPTYKKKSARQSVEFTKERV